MKDKCVCYIIVLAVLNSNYSLDITPLAEELHMGTKRVLDLGRVLRFTVNKSTLSLQLPLPVVTEGKPKAGKRK